MSDLSAQHPRIAVVAAGAIGAYYGGRLAYHGHSVHFLTRSDYDHVRRHGWTIYSCDGNFSLSPERLAVYANPAEIGPVDLVLVTLKTTANNRFPSLIQPLLHDRTAILTLQNGLGNEDALAALFGGDRVIGGLAFICANRTDPGKIVHTAHGLVRIGEYARSDRQRVEQIAALFNAAGIRCEVLDDLARGRWEKLVWNVPFNGLGAALDLTTQDLLASEWGTEEVRGLMAEVIQTARACGVDLADDLIADQICKTREMGAYRTSMQVDRQSGRRLEIDSIFAKTLQAADSAGLSTPKLRHLLDLLRIVDGAIPASSSPVK